MLPMMLVVTATRLETDADMREIAMRRVGGNYTSLAGFRSFVKRPLAAAMISKLNQQTQRVGKVRNESLNPSVFDIVVPFERAQKRGP
jgi:hypothetical protein